jgi:hypothetical protein
MGGMGRAQAAKNTLRNHPAAFAPETSKCHVPTPSRLGNITPRIYTIKTLDICDFLSMLGTVTQKLPAWGTAKGARLWIIST